MRLGSLSNLLQSRHLEIPFTYHLAKVICDYYQYLIGIPFDDAFNDVSAIKAIVVTPFDMPDKELFIKKYYPFNVDFQLLQNESGFFDVVVIAHMRHDNEICAYKNLRSFTMSKGIRFNPDDFE